MAGIEYLDDHMPEKIKAANERLLKAEMIDGLGGHRKIKAARTELNRLLNRKERLDAVRD